MEGDTSGAAGQQRSKEVQRKLDMTLDEIRSSSNSWKPNKAAKTSNEKPKADVQGGVGSNADAQPLVSSKEVQRKLEMSLDDLLKSDYKKIEEDVKAKKASEKWWPNENSKWNGSDTNGMNEAADAALMVMLLSTLAKGTGRQLRQKNWNDANWVDQNSTWNPTWGNQQRGIKRTADGQQKASAKPKQPGATPPAQPSMAKQVGAHKPDPALPKSKATVPIPKATAPKETSPASGPLPVGPLNPGMMSTGVPQAVKSGPPMKAKGSGKVVGPPAGKSTGTAGPVMNGVPPSGGPKGTTPAKQVPVVVAPPRSLRDAEPLDAQASSSPTKGKGKGKGKGKTKNDNDGKTGEKSVITDDGIQKRDRKGKKGDRKGAGKGDRKGDWKGKGVVVRPPGAPQDAHHPPSNDTYAPPPHDPYSHPPPQQYNYGPPPNSHGYGPPPQYGHGPQGAPAPHAPPPHLAHHHHHQQPQAQAAPGYSAPPPGYSGAPAHGAPPAYGQQYAYSAPSYGSPNQDYQQSPGASGHQGGAAASGVRLQPRQVDLRPKTSGSAAMTVRLSNLPPELTARDLADAFSEVCKQRIESVDLMRDHTGMATGEGVVTFNSYADAQHIVTQYNGGDLNGRRLHAYLVNG